MLFKKFVKPKSILIASLIVTLVTIGMTYQAAQGGAPPEAFDFHCYSPDRVFSVALKPNFGAPFTLEDQFGLTNHVLTGLMTQFCASADKRSSGVDFVFPSASDPTNFTCYAIDGDSPGKTVVLTDQFGSFIHDVGRLVEVCVPTNKTPPVGFPEPIKLDNHWKCYSIVGDPLPKTVFMFEQFNHVFGTITPELLCAPAIKVVDGGTPEVPELPDLHLKCYDIVNVHGSHLVSSVFNDQFVRNRVGPAMDDRICVEAIKSFPTVGGTLIPIDTTALLLASSQMTASWMIPVIIAGIGIGIVLVRKSENP